jgi:hypothetical protein
MAPSPVRSPRHGPKRARADAGARPFDGFVEYVKRVSPTCLVIWSATATACQRPSPIGRSACGSIPSGSSLSPRARSSASIGASSSALMMPERTVYDWRHYLAVLQRKPGALRNGAPFAELPRVPAAAAAPAQDAGRRPRDGRDPRPGPAARRTGRARRRRTGLEAGAPTKTHILNLLHRLVDGKPLDPPRRSGAARPDADQRAAGRRRALRRAAPDGGARHAS